MNKITIIIIFIISVIIISCSDDGYRTTDIVTVSSVNTFITKADIEKKIKRTSAQTTAVTLSHQAHEDSGTKCITCHHKKKNDTRVKKCAFCHKGLKGANHLHKFCIKCHKEKDEGPVSCNECHIEGDEVYINEELKNEYKGTYVYDKNIRQIHEKAGIKCIVCHHESSNIDGKMKQERSCLECHYGRSRMRIMHVFCKDCHKRKDDIGIISKKRGPVKCDGCHKEKVNI